MPILYLRRLTGKRRNTAADRQLACVLAFFAGAVDAGGLLAVGQYTSHMSGIASTIAGGLARGDLRIFLGALASVVFFLIGSVVSSVLIHAGRRRRMHSQYALPLLLEATLLLVCGLLGVQLQRAPSLVFTEAALLCLAMGLQNAMITKLSHAVIRTTHVTGMVTDIGIELGRLLYAGRRGVSRFRMVREKLALLASLILLFIAGGFFGAVTVQRVGFLFVIPPAIGLAALAAMPVLDDIASAVRTAPTDLARPEGMSQGK